MLTWPEIERSELFSWFGMHEVGRTPGDGGVTVYHLKPGGYQESVDFVVAVDGRQAVRGATLSLARSWIDDPQTAPFAADLAKSALQTLGAGNATCEELAQRLWATVEADPHVLRGAGMARSSLAPPAPPIDALLAAYFGAVVVHGNWEAEVVLLLENEIDAGVNRLVITFDYPQ